MDVERADPVSTDERAVGFSSSRPTDDKLLVLAANSKHFSSVALFLRFFSIRALVFLTHAHAYNMFTYKHEKV
jgi:hypothetical protein